MAPFLFRRTPMAIGAAMSMVVYFHITVLISNDFDQKQFTILYFFYSFRTKSPLQEYPAYDKIAGPVRGLAACVYLITQKHILWTLLPLPDPYSLDPFHAFLI